MVYLHTIGSAAVQLCPDGDPKAIRLLYEGFLAGAKGDRTRLSYPGGYPIAIQRLEGLTASF